MQAARGTGSEPLVVFFRNHGVGELTPELVAVSELLWEQEVPVTHAVEPGNLTDECAAWLRERQAENGRLLEITQHGYHGARHEAGEFGGGRSYREQYDDLERGLKIMDDRFGDGWFRAISLPQGHHNRDTLRAIEDLGYLSLSGRHDAGLSGKLVRSIGRVLKGGRGGSDRLGQHLAAVPGTNAFAISWTIDLLADGAGDGLADRDDLLRRFEEARGRTDVIGWRLHHRLHGTPASLDLLRETVAELRGLQPAIEFRNSAEILAAHGPRKLSRAGR